MLCLRWTDDFIRLLSSQQPNLAALCRSSAFLGLVDTLAGLMFSTNGSVCLLSCQILVVLVSSAVNDIPASVLKKFVSDGVFFSRVASAVFAISCCLHCRCYEGCVLRLSDANAYIQEACTSLLSAIPLNMASMFV